MGDSNHTYKPSDKMVTRTGTATNAAAAAPTLIDDVEKSSMVAGVKYDLGNFQVAADFLTRTNKDSNGSGVLTEDKVSAIGIHFWGTSGTFQPGFSYTTETAPPATGSDTKTNQMAAGVKWVPGWKNAYV